MDLEEIKDRKRQLDEDITRMLQEFEQATGAGVYDLDLVTTSEMGRGCPRVAYCQIKITIG